VTGSGLGLLLGALREALIRALCTPSISLHYGDGLGGGSTGGATCRVMQSLGLGLEAVFVRTN